MGRTSLSSLVDGPGAGPALAVLSRGRGAWEPQATGFGDEVRGLAAALSGYGLRAGSCAAVLGSEGAGTLRAGLAVLAAGATLVPLDPALSDDALRRALGASGAVQAIASDERQLTRILALRPDLPALELVLLAAAAPSERKPAALLVQSAVEVGAAGLLSDPDLLRRTLAESEGGTACLIVDAAGETRPIARAALLILAETIAKTLGVAQGKTVLAGLPVGGVERLGAVLAVFGQGATLLLPDPGERPDGGLDQQPADAVLLDVTGLERLYRAWTEDIEAKSWFGRRAMRWALRQGREGERQGWKHRVAESLALRGLREKLGGRADTLDVIAGVRGGASSEVDAFFSSAGLSVRYFSPASGGTLAR